MAKIERNSLLSVLSEALDCVEAEVFGATSFHGKRVAWLCVCMGRRMGMSEEELSDLAVGALLHDNALIEYRKDYEGGILRPGVSGQEHCVAGEDNLLMVPGCRTLRGYVRFHHERADGKGPFRKLPKDTPLGAQLIHIADEVDVRFGLGSRSAKDLREIQDFVRRNEGILFSEEACEGFLGTFTEDCVLALADQGIEELELGILPVWVELSLETPENGEREAGIGTIVELFARIIDYKSPFTRNHSVGVAEKAARMAGFYHYDQERASELYLAGALHDIGKLMVDLDVLEKPGRLTQKEYQHIQAHAYETWCLLSKVPGLKRVARWASCHHEKLDGTGYPFRKAAQELGEEERLLACLDIYQALTEDRPYKAGMSHEKAVGILREMAGKRELDGRIVEDIAEVFAGQETGEEADKKRTALFQCPVCGYIHEEDVVPDGFSCPVCRQEGTSFARIL